MKKAQEEKQDLETPLPNWTKDDLKEVVLHNSYMSPPCVKVRCILQHNGIKFQVIDGKKKDSEYKKIPVLLLNGVQINDSFIMVKNLAPILYGKALTEEEIKVRLAVYEDLEGKKKENPALKNAQIIETGPLLGVRQTRFVEGLYKITGDDIIAGTMFEDTIAMASNPIIHYFGYRRYLEHDGYGIPYRCLLPKKVDNMLVVGRCMSSDQQAYESWRAMAHIMAIAEGAGTAAALSVKSGIEPKQLDVAALREEAELSSVPAIVKGTALNMILAGLLSLAFMGFAGLFSAG